MDWIDPQYAIATEDRSSPTGTKPRRKSKKSRGSVRAKAGKPLRSQVAAALAQPLDVWSVAYDHALAKLTWPRGLTVESTFLWSALIQEQAEVLVRAGMSAKKLAAIISGEPDSTGQELADVVGLMEQSLDSLAFSWLDSADSSPSSALASIALAWHLPEHARRPGNEWITQWLQAALDRVETYEADLSEPAICNLVFQCELPLLIGIATTASKRTVLAEATKAMDHLAQHLETSEDDPGPWLMHGATYLRAALACVLRCRILANSHGLRKWYPPQQKALAGLLKHAARWCRPDGTQLLAACSPAPKANALWEALVQQTKSPKSMTAALMLSGITKCKRRQLRKEVRVNSLPALTHYSEPASNMCMQSDWRHKGCRIALDFSDTNICFEALGPKGVPVLAGEWTTQVELDGQAQMQLDSWQEVCWFSDDDVDYLELEARFGPHAKIQRQTILFREERLLLLADALMCDKEAPLSLRSGIPLAGEARFQPAKKTCEGLIETPSCKCLTLPLHLPEWRRQLSHAADNSQLFSKDDQLVAVAETRRSRLYLPILISLCSSHSRLPFTWRHLTVADDLRIVSRDEAQAFRVQIGADQWLMYRNLARPVRRSALGMHTIADFYAARFDADGGELDTIVEVEAARSE